MGSKSEDQLSASPLSLSRLACFPHWGPPSTGQSSGCQTRKGQSGGFISTLWRKCRSKPFSSFHVKGVGVRCYPAYSGEMPPFPPRPASHLPHCLGDSIFQRLIVLPTELFSSLIRCIILSVYPKLYLGVIHTFQTHNIHETHDYSLEDRLL